MKINVKRLLARCFHLLLRNNLLAAKLLGVKFGDGCKFIGDPIALFGSEPWAVEIGDRVELTNGVQIITHDGALWVLRKLEHKFASADIIKKVIIGDNVFVGVNTVILPGVTVGSNVIIGAGSVVTHDISDNSVAVGAPARVIKSINQYAQNIEKFRWLNTNGLSSTEKRAIWEKEL